MQDDPPATPDKDEDQAIAHLIASLADADEHVRAAAAYDLAYSGAAHAVEKPSMPSDGTVTPALLRSSSQHSPMQILIFVP